MAWAFSTVRQPDERLFIVLARTTERLMGEFQVQEFTNMSWMHAAVKRSNDKAFGIWEFAHILGRLVIVGRIRVVPYQ